jgi:hypothetical protein
MFVPLLLLLRGKSPDKTKQKCATDIFSECVVTYRTRRKFLLRVRKFLFHKTCLHLPLSWLHFFFVSFRLLSTAHPNNFFFLRSWQTSTHFASRNWRFLIANTSKITVQMSKITVQILHWRKSKAPLYKRDRMIEPKWQLFERFGGSGSTTGQSAWDLWWGDYHTKCI